MAIHENFCSNFLSYFLANNITTIKLFYQTCVYCNIFLSILDKFSLSFQLQSKDLHVQKAEQDLQSCNEKLSEYTKQIEGFEWKIGEKIKNIAYLEDVIKMKDSEAKQTKNLIEKIKNLNSEHCQELQLQIDSVSYFAIILVTVPSHLKQ